MRKIVAIALIALTSLSCVAQQGYRYDVVPGLDNTYAIPYREIKAVAYASSVALAPTMEITTYNFATLTGAMTVTAVVTPCYTGDKMICLFKANTTSRTVTFSTGFSANGALTVLASGSAQIEFTFNGTSWVEKGRSNFTNAIVNGRTNTAFTANATLTPAQLSGGLLTITSGTDTLTLPSATAIAAQIGATAGTTLDFALVNIAAGGTALLVVGSGITASGFPSTNTLSLAKSATVGVATFRLQFLSATAATLTRLN